MRTRKIDAIRYMELSPHAVIWVMSEEEYKLGFGMNSYHPTKSSMKRLEKITKLMAPVVHFDEYTPIITWFRLFTPTELSKVPDDWMDWIDDEEENFSEGHPAEYGDN